MNFELARFNMVEQQIRPFNVKDNRIIGILTTIKREQFVLPEYKPLAFADVEIRLPSAGKMFTPKLDAFILQALELDGKCKVLEVGSGSGYLTSLIARLAKFVYSFETNEVNYKFAVKNLTNVGVINVSLINDDGFGRCVEYAPFDRIVIGGAVYSDRLLDGLKLQLNKCGVLLAIVGAKHVQKLLKVIRLGESKFEVQVLLETSLDYLESTEVYKEKFIF